MAKQYNILITEPGSDYELIDSGDGEKLERFGKFVLCRPDPQALWHKKLSNDDWKKADGVYKKSALLRSSQAQSYEGQGEGEEKPAFAEATAGKGDWKMKKEMPSKWMIDFGGLKLNIKPTAFKHTGLFPEQSVNWDWLRSLVIPATGGESSRTKAGIQCDTKGSEIVGNDIEVLNLFGYTGGATLACAQAGAKMVHVDGSKSAITWARENAEASGLANKPIRWILDDARTFVRRELKRERKYDGIIMDPPAFGHGPENELWKIEEHFLPLVDECLKLLKDKPLFFLINGYSAGYSALAYENNLLPLIEKFGGKIEVGELAIAEAEVSPQRGGLRGEASATSANRLLPTGIFARWSK
jgi:23S rRNA (cytosine1962-C5)-methyltransferase